MESTPVASVSVPVVETPSIGTAAEVVTTAPRSYGISKKYWKSEKVVPDFAQEPKEPLKAVVKQTPVTPAPPGAKPPRSYSISKKYWATGAAASPATTAAAAVAPRSYSISTQYWKTEPVATSAVVEEENTEVAKVEAASASTGTDTDSALPRRSYGISKPYWKKSSTVDARATLTTLMSSRSSIEQKEESFAPLRKLRQENIQWILLIFSKTMQN